MCGIAGIINFNQIPMALNQIKAMTDSIAHRGPDGEGHYINGPIALGHRRLSILDLSSAGKQPMQSADGNFILTYNGEIYNFREIRSQLELLGHVFYSRTDSEVVLNSFVEWGIKCIDKFNGMFSFAIWDKKQQKLFLARDRYGIKPCYYYIHDRYFIFASEIKAIIATNIYQPALNQTGLVEYLTFQNFFTDNTLFEDIKMLPAGYYAEINIDRTTNFKKYWDFNFQETLDIKEEEATEELTYLFTQAVKRQLISDVDVNAYLSGGIDSAAITMIASQHLQNLRTFTIGFDLNSATGLELAFDERSKAEYVSYLAKTEHYEMVLKAGDMERCLNALVWHQEEPRVGQSYPNFYAAKLASKFSKVVLSGSGGDELFGGYPWRYFYSEKPRSFNDFIDHYYLKWQRLIPNTLLMDLVSPLQVNLSEINTRNIFADVYNYNSKDTIQSQQEFSNYSFYLEAKTFLHGLLVVEDKLSMAHSLETRIPFLDNDLVDFASKIPVKFKINEIYNQILIDENRTDKKREYKSNHGKKILRNALATYVSDRIVQSDKQGFSAPDASWWKGESINFVKKHLLRPKAKINEILNPRIVEDIFEKHVSGQQNYRLVLWSFIYLETFLETFNLV